MDIAEVREELADRWRGTNERTVILRMEGTTSMNQSQAMAVRGTRGRGAQGWHAARIALLAFTTLPAYGALWLMPQAALQRALPAALAGQVTEAATSGAVVQVHELPGMTRELYEQATSALGLPGPPPGSHLHASGPTDSGWRIVEVWASEAAANAFYGSAQFQQTTQRLGLPQPAISSYPVETVKVASPVALPDTGTSTLLQSHGALVAGAALLLLIGMLTVRRMAPRS